MKAITWTYSRGYRTYEKAELAIIDDLSEGLLSECERPRVAAYRTKDGHKRYQILVNDLGLMEYA